MTSYWKRRWPNQVLFGSYRDLNYRLDIVASPHALFKLSTAAGPGFALELARCSPAPGFLIVGETPAGAQQMWLDDEPGREAVRDLLGPHFSTVTVRPDTIICTCDPGRDDLLPEGALLDWCLSRLHLLMSRVPAADRRALSRAVFIG